MSIRGSVGMGFYLFIVFIKTAWSHLASGGTNIVLKYPELITV